MTAPTTTRAQAERHGEKYNVEGFLKIQAETIKALHEIAAQFKPGMLEEEGYELAKKYLADQGFEKNWHRPYVRFGENTSLMYGKPSKPGIRLGENDIFYLDIGPVKGTFEGDAGDTFLTGSNPEMQRCIDDTRALFKETARVWRAEKLSGQALYECAATRASALGWELNSEWNGHRIADFPHQLYFKGSLAALDFTPSGGLWILEIHLKDPKGRFGAFYEDLLA